MSSTCFDRLGDCEAHSAPPRCTRNCSNAPSDVEPTDDAREQQTIHITVVQPPQQADRVSAP